MRCLVLIMALGVAGGCGGRDAHEHAHEPVAASPAVAPEAPAAVGLVPVALHDGARWRLDDHTRAVLDEARAALRTSPSSLDEAHALGDTLQAQLDRLIEGCTMAGADHDALHGLLTVYMPLVGQLQSVSDLPTAASTVVTLRTMLAEAEGLFE